VPRKHRELLHTERQIFRDVGEDHLGDDQHDDEPVQELGDMAPAGGSVTDGHTT
jgi:hypothetical protein